MKMFRIVISVFIFCVLGQHVLSQSLANSFSVANANNNFSVDIYRMLAVKDGVTPTNLFLSPISISSALAMAYLGARGDTANEMAKTLHWDEVPAQQLHTAMKMFLGNLNHLNGGENKLLTANKLFVQQGLQTSQFTREILKFYGVNATQVDYKNNPGAARNLVNDWVEQQTGNKIRNIIPEGGFDTTTKLVLVNAIYFKGFWQHVFDKKKTHKAPFTNSHGKKVDVQMMTQVGDFNIHFNIKLKLKAIELPYKDQKCSIFIILPQESNGLPNLEKALTVELVKRIIAETRKASLKGIHVTIPKFSITKSFELSAVLKSLGAIKMFSNEADFSGITQTEKLQVSQVIHKAFVEVSEEGTIAAAATVVQMGRMASPQFVADHPFMFLIIENNANSILFMGRFVNPMDG